MSLNPSSRAKMYPGQGHVGLYFFFGFDFLLLFCCSDVASCSTCNCFEFRIPQGKHLALVAPLSFAVARSDTALTLLLVNLQTLQQP